MSKTLKAAVESYLRAKTVSGSTRNEYFSTLRNWERWGDGPPIEQLQHKQIREFLDWVHERALAQDGINPGRTANKAREHLRAVISWAWEQELIDTLPRYPQAKGATRCCRSALPDEGRDQRPLLCDASDEASPRLGQPVPGGTVLASRARRLFQLRGRYRNRLEVRPLPRTDSLAACNVGAAVARSRSKGAVTLGVAVLPPREDRQDLLPADESRRACTSQEHPVGERQPGRARFPGGRSTPQRTLPGALRPRWHQAEDEYRDGAGRTVGTEGPPQDVCDVLR
jgi:hypothetical protein